MVSRRKFCRLLVSLPFFATAGCDLSIPTYPRPDGLLSVPAQQERLEAVQLEKQLRQNSNYQFLPARLGAVSIADFILDNIPEALIGKRPVKRGGQEKHLFLWGIKEQKGSYVYYQGDVELIMVMESIERPFSVDQSLALVFDQRLIAFYSAVKPGGLFLARIFV